MTSGITSQIDDSWKSLLQDSFNAPYFQNIKNFIFEERSKYTIFPPDKFIFEALNKTPVDKVKVVIIGQDPYHGKGQAHGLCFSVQHGIKPPPSLVNIFKELKSDLGIQTPSHGCLDTWATQGILLLNATLTVRENQAGSHQKKGWEEFTDTIIKKISSEKSGLVFLLWGRFAQDKESLIAQDKNHYILKAAHPSPFSAYNGFLGCKHFSKTNDILRQNIKEEIDWTLPEIKGLF